jgi:hypothetical protein
MFSNCEMSVVFNVKMICDSCRVHQNCGIFSLYLFLSSSWCSIFPVFMESHIESAQQTVVKPFRVSVEGNIGAGKSTLITHFSSFPDVDARMVSCYIKFQKC